MFINDFYSIFNKINPLLLVKKDFEFGIHEFMRNLLESKVNPDTLFQS